MNIFELVQAAKQRLFKNRLYEVLLIVAIIGSYCFVVSGLVFIYSAYLAVFCFLLLSLAALYLLWTRNVFQTVSIQDAALELDQELETRGQFSTAMYLKSNESGAEETEDKKIQAAFLERKLTSTVKEFNPETAWPYMMSGRIKRGLYSLPVLYLLFAILFFAYYEPRQTAAIQADVIRSLVEEQEDLPEDLKERLSDLADTLDANALSSEEVAEAIDAAEAELDEALEDAETAVTDGEEESRDFLEENQEKRPEDPEFQQSVDEEEKEDPRQI